MGGGSQAMPVGHLAPQLALIIGAALCLVAVVFLPRRRQWVGSGIAFASLAAAIGLSIELQIRIAPRLTFSGTWALDGLTAWVTWVSCGAAALAVAFSPRWFASDRRHGEWYVMVLLATLGTTLLAGAADMLELMVAMLLVSVTGYTLASYHRAAPSSAEAGAKYFLLGALTNPLLLLGIVLLYGLAGSTRYGTLATALAGGWADPVVLLASFAFVLVGLVFELGAVPAHPWVPDVSEGSPAPAAAFLTVVPKVGALAAIARFVALFPEDAVPWRPLVAVLALMTMTVGNLAALWQGDVRRLLGWSSVSQAGYGLMAVVALGRSSLALPALVAFMVAYALGNLTAFGVVISLRGRTRMEDYRGLARSRPWHAAALTVALLSLVGIPPLAGFTAKLTLFGAALEAGYAWLALVAVLNTVVSVFYYLRVIAQMVLEPPGGRVALLGGPAAVVTLMASVGLVVAGVLAEPLIAAAATLVLLP